MASGCHTLPNKVFLTPVSYLIFNNFRCYMKFLIHLKFVTVASVQKGPNFIQYWGKAN